MKKLMLSLLVLAAAMNVAALPKVKGQGTITITSQSGYTATLTLTMSDDFTDGVNKGYCSLDYTDGKMVDIYALYGGQKYSTFGTKDWENVEIGVTPADNETEYTLSFSYVSGEPIVFYAGGKKIEVDENKTFEFSTTPGAANYLSKLSFSMTAPSLNPQICHIGDNLEITGYAGASWYVQVVGYEHDTFVALGEVEITKDFEQINLKQINVDETATTYKNQYKVLMYRLVDGQKQDEKTPLVIYYEKK